MKRVIRIAIVVLATLATSVSGYSQGQVPDAEELQALKDLYDSLGGSAWTNNPYWPTSGTLPVNYNQSYGVWVQNGDITRIYLHNCNVIGKIPASIGKLKKLTYIFLHSNVGLTGRIPAELGDVTALEYLYLNNSKLSGTIPSSLGNLTNLKLLHLQTNQLSGSIPSSLNNLNKLSELSLARNQLTGAIPNLSGLVELTGLSLHTNPFTPAPLPLWITTLPKLVGLTMTNTKLTGSIPPELSNLKTLAGLSLDHNQLTGSIPPSLSELTNLASLNLGSNQLSGSLPAGIGSMTKLAQLYLNNNAFTGPVPKEIGNLNLLTHLYLNVNQLSGELPTELGNLTKLQMCFLSVNKFIGRLPASLANLVNLGSFYIEGNQFEGEFPSYVGNWTKLTALSMNGNKFHGAFPSAIGNCPLLNYMRADNNFFTSLPATMLNLPNLSLNFENNELTSIPNFANHVRKSTLTVWIKNNRLDFSQLQPMMNTGILSFTYSPQKTIADVTNVYVARNQPLVIPGRPPGTNTTVVWEKKQSQGTWAVASGNQDATGKEFRKAVASVADAGTYRWKATNSDFPVAFSIMSNPIEVSVTDELNTSLSRRYYSGLITAARWHTEKPQGELGQDFSGMYVYDYDEKYQIKEARWASANETLQTWAWEGNKYRLTGMTYDANGNILTLKRYNNAGANTNNFTYHYQSNANKLLDVDGYTEQAGAVHGFTYDALGRMTGENKLEANADQYVDYDVTGKVVAVYADAAKSAASKKVEYLYDDRGFRLAKVSFAVGGTVADSRTTWYIRDASGNVLSTYEQAGVPDTANTHAPVETEVPVYGSGKLGILYPAQDYSMNYELTDHLGNVRALLRDNINTYTATMEDNGQAELSNPAVQEVSYFENITETEVTDNHMNHTAPMPGVVDDPDKSAYLYWVSGMPGSEAVDRSVGPAIALKVNAGDKLSLEVWARYLEKTSYTNNVTPLLFSTMLGSTFAGKVGFEGQSAANTAAKFGNALAGLWGTASDEGRPRAFLNYIVFNNAMESINADRVQVGDDAAFEIGDEAIGMHQKLSSIVNIPADGYIYVWVNNASEATKVWFDDLRVEHASNLVVQATDYGVWGEVLREQKSDESTYRFGYQGQFSERDLETGWNHFELREYDPVIGRWLVPDPIRQHWSSYLAMGNNPVNRVDVDGGKDGPGDECPECKGVGTMLNVEVVAIAAPMTDTEKAEYDFQQANWVQKIDHYNAFGRWLERVLPEPKAGLAYFAKGKNGVGPILVTRDGTVDGFVTDPGDLPVFNGGGKKGFPKGHIPSGQNTATIIKAGADASKNVHEGIEKVHKVGEGWSDSSELYDSPSVGEFYDSLLFMQVMGVEGDKGKTIRRTIYKNSEKVDTLDVNINDF